MGGKRQANILSSIITNFQTVEDVIESSSNASGSAMAENEKYLDSIQGKIDQFNNAVQTMWMNFLNDEAVKWIIQFGTGLVKLVDQFGLLNTAVGAFTAVKTIGFKGLKEELDAINTDSSKVLNIFGKKQDTQGLKDTADAIKGITVAKKAENVVTQEGVMVTEKQTAADAVGQAVRDKDTGSTITNTAATWANVAATKALVIAKNLLKGLAFGIIAGIATNAITAGLAKLQDYFKSAEEKAKELKQQVDELTDSYKEAKKEFSGNLEILTKTDTEGYDDLLSEFEDLAKGVNNLGENVSLTTDEYSRYKEICEAIVGVNPSLANGYDNATQAISANKGALAQLIELQKEEARLAAAEYVSYGRYTNNGKFAAVAQDAINQFEEANEGLSENINNPAQAVYDSFSWSQFGTQKYGDIWTTNDDLAAFILEQLGKTKDEIDAILADLKYQDENLYTFSLDKWFQDGIVEISENKEQFLASLEQLRMDGVAAIGDPKEFARSALQYAVDNADADFNGKWFGSGVDGVIRKYLLSDGSFDYTSFAKEYEGYIGAYKDIVVDKMKQFVEDSTTEFEDYTSGLKDAQDGMIQAYLEVPNAIEGYYDLSLGTRSYITEWIKNSPAFKVDENTTTEQIEQAKDTIISAVKSVLGNDELSKAFNDLAALNTSKGTFSAYQAQVKEIFKQIYDELNKNGKAEEIWGLTEDNYEQKIAVQYNLEWAIDDSDETSDLSKFIATAKRFTGKTDEEIQDYLGNLQPIEVQRMLKYDYSSMEGFDNPDTPEFDSTGTMEQMKKAANPDVEKSYTNIIQTYSSLSEAIDKVNTALETSKEIFFVGAKVTEDYYNSLMELGVTTEELGECIDKESGYIVTNVDKLNELIKAQKDTVAWNIKLSKSQAELQYHEVIRSISDQIALEGNLANVNMEVVDSFLEQASALRTTINQYQLLENSLLGATNAFTQFSKAQEIDSQNTYGSTLVEMAQTMYDAIYKTGEVGSEAFWAAVKATVPNDIYMGLAPGEQQIQAISRYLQDNLFSGLTFSGDSFSIDYNSIESFVKRAQAKGLFSGTDTTEFGLSSAFIDSLVDGENGLKKFAEQLGVTEEYVYAIFSEIDKYNANGFGLSMLFQLDSSTTSQMTILNTQLEQAYATRKRLIAQGADLSANTAEISRIQSQQAQTKAQATDNTTKYLTATNALKDPTKQVKDVLSQELILEIGLNGEQTVESAFQKISDWLLQLEEPTVLDLQISQESVQNSIQELENTFGKENLETELKIRNKVIDGPRNDAIGDAALDQYSDLLNLDQYIDDALSADLTTTESLLTQIAKNTGIMAGTDDTSGATTTDTTQSGTTSTVNLKVDQEKPKVSIDAYAKEVYEQFQDAIDRMNELGIGPTDTIFGNIDTNNRQVLEWTDETLNQYKEALQSWFKDENGISIPWDQIVGDLSGSFSTVLGASNNYDGIEIAFSPMLQTENGAVLLNADTVDKYIYGLIAQANPDGWTKEELLALDAKGLEIEGQKIQGLLADIGDTAIQTGEAMHWTGLDGAYTEVYQLVAAAAAQAGMTVTEWIDKMRMAMLGVEDTTNNASGSMIASLYEVKQTGIDTYSTLQNQITSYNDIVSQTSEILTNGTKVTAEYKNSLIALGVDKTELNACFDAGTGLILKDIDALNKLVDAAKKNTVNNVRLAKSQAQLRYYELCEEMRAVIGTSDQLRASQVANINKLYQEMGTVQGTIAQYSILESQLLGVANAYERIAEAQQMDSAMDYGSKATELVSILAGAFNTGKLGTEAAKVAFKGLIPDSVITAIDPDEQMSQAYKYFKEGPLSKLFKIEYGKDGSVSSVDMPLENVKSYIEELTKEGKVFTGTWDQFDLNPNIKSMDDFAQALGVTKEVAFGLLTTLEQYDISWLGGDMETLIDQLMGDNLEYSIQKSTAKTAQLLQEKARILGKDPSQRSDDEKKRLQEINVELEAQNKIMEANRESATTMWQDFSSGEDAVKTLSELEQEAALTEGQFNQIFGNISEGTREKFGLTWNDDTSVADYLEKVRDMQLALGQPTELVLELAKSDAEEQIKGILGVDSLGDPITLQAKFEFDAETGEYKYNGKDLSDEQAKKLTEAYNEWIKLYDILNKEDYTKKQAEAIDSIDKNVSAISEAVAGGTDDSPSDDTNSGGDNPPPNNTDDNPQPEGDAGGNQREPQTNPVNDIIDAVSSANSNRINADLTTVVSTIGDAIAKALARNQQGNANEGQDLSDEEKFNQMANYTAMDDDVFVDFIAHNEKWLQKYAESPLSMALTDSQQKLADWYLSQYMGKQSSAKSESAMETNNAIQDGVAQGVAAAATILTEQNQGEPKAPQEELIETNFGKVTDYTEMGNDAFGEFINGNRTWYEQYLQAPAGSIKLTEQQKGLIDFFMPKDMKQELATRMQDLPVEPQTMTADAQQVVVNGPIEQTGDKSPESQSPTETPAQSEQLEVQGIDADETGSIEQATEQVNAFNQATEQAGNSATQMWVDYMHNESALAALNTIQDTTTQLTQEEAAKFGIEIDENQTITVQEAIDQLIAKKKELETPAVMRAVLECEGIDMEIQQLKEKLDLPDSELELEAYLKGISVDDLRAEIEEQIQELQTEKVLTMAGAFNIELNPEDAAEVAKKLAEIEATKFTKKNVSISMSGVDYAIKKVTALRDRINEINTDIQIDVAVNDKPNSGDDKADGTAHARGTAFKSGSWGAPKTETALVGELGPELLVRGNRWTTVGQNGAEFTDVRKGDIIFNHKQTRSLLENGYVTGRGKAFAEGTAYAGINTWTNQANFSNTNSASHKLSQAADDLSSAADDLSEDFEEIFDWIEVRIEEITETINLLGAQFENAIGSINQNAIIDDQINMNKQLYDNLIAGANEYYKFAAELLKKVPKEYRTAAQNGQIAIEYFKGKVGQQALEAIQNYREWVQKGADFTQQAEETLTEISNLAKQAIDNIASDYENKKSFPTIKMDQYEAYNSLLETGAGTESARVYEEIIKENNKNIVTLQEQRNKMQAELNKQVEAGNIKKYSQNWYDAINDIAAVDTEIIELTTDTENYQDTINELHWDHFDNLISRLEAVSNEADNLIDILSAKDLVDKDTAEWTDEGITSLGLYAQKLEVAEMQADKYAKEIRYLNDNWKALGYTEQEYVEKLEELKANQFDAIKAYNQTKDAIVDLNKERVDEIKNIINKEIEAFEKLTQAKKKELDSEKD